MASVSCSLATSMCTARMAMRLGKPEVVGIGVPASGGVALGVLDPSQMFLNWNPNAMGGHQD